MSEKDGNNSSSNIGESTATKPVEAGKKGLNAFKSAKSLFKAGKFIFSILKKIMLSIIKWVLTLIGPYALIVIVLIVLLMIVLDSVKVFDFFQDGNSRTDAAVIFDNSVSIAMENQMKIGPQEASDTIDATQRTAPYPKISEAWLSNAAKSLSQSIAIPTIHHYMNNLESKSYKPWHRKFEKDDASDPEALKAKYVEYIESELQYYFDGPGFNPEFTMGTPPVEEYIETHTTTSCTKVDEEGNRHTTVTGPTVSKTVLPSREIVLDVTIGYIKGVVSYANPVTESISTTSSGDCSSTVKTIMSLYVVDEATPLMMEFLPKELVRILVADAKEGKYTKLVKAQNLEYAIDLGKEVDENFPRPDIKYADFIKCMQKKNANLDTCLDENVIGGTFNFGVGSASGGWYPQEYEALYKKYAEMAGIDWFILAAVHGKETTFSTNPVATDPSKGSYNKRGELIGAVGHYQFMSATWVGWASMKDYDVSSKGAIRGDISFIKVPANISKYGGLGKDANGDGVADPWNLEDSMYAAALYIKSYGYVKGNEAAIKTALAKYNGGPTYYTSSEAQNYAASVYATGIKFESGNQGTQGNISMLPGDITYPTVGRYSSTYGSRYLALYGERRMHYGIDIANVVGTPIVSVADGVVAYAGPHATWGNYIKIRHNINGQQFQTLYAHMSKLDVRTGATVSKGTQIGLMGHTGNSTGPHLHLEVYLPPYSYPGSIINPLTIVPLPPQ
ncbi:MAG: peptidoglycan DD-metalloendopeptidase family protein [Kurthia sp.]|nr:peptidoglycan DD-metalloendopeptidase family protein [Candidatus Kurthia equi]